MKTKAIIPMLVGVGIGLLALKLGWNFIEQSRQSAAASQGDTPVVLAGRKVPPGTPLQEADFTVVKWARSNVPKGSFSEVEALAKRVNLSPLHEGLPILENMLAPPGAAPGLPALIPTGYLAMTVKVDEFAGVAGFLKPDDKVDVVATFSVKRSKSGKNETVTRTILRDITVCAVGSEIQPDENNQPMIVRSATLLVTPEQGQKLSLASTRGTIRLAMRSGQGPDSTTSLKAISFDELLRSDPNGQGQDDPSEQMGKWVEELLASNKAAELRQLGATPKTDPYFSMQIIKGTKAQDVIFENCRSSRRVDPNSVEQQEQTTTDLRNFQGTSPENKAKISNLLDKFFGQQEAGE